MARRSRKRPRKNQTSHNAVKKSSLGWFDLPLEMREIIIDEMDAKTRCRFAQCSKWCEYEAKKSNNYLYRIELRDNIGDNFEPQLLLSHTETLEWDYSLEFVDAQENKTIVEYKCGPDSGNVVKWAKMESGKLENVRRKYLNEYTEKYSHSIRVFFITLHKSLVTDYNIKNLKNLEEFAISLLPLEYSTSCGINLVECGFIELKQLIRLKHLFAPNLKLTFEQITELKCDTIHVESTDFSEENTNKYLKMIKKGEMHENTTSIVILISRGSTIENVQNITNGLEIFNCSEEENNVEHKDEIGRSRTPYTFNFLSDVKKNGMFRFFVTSTCDFNQMDRNSSIHSKI